MENALSHDLEGSIRGIKSLAGNLLMQKHSDLLAGDAGEMVQLLGAEAKRASRLLDGLMDWLECIRQPFLFDWQDTARIAREVFTAVTVLAPQRRIEFRCQTLPPVWSDPAALRKIFRELLSNSVKFTGPQSCPVITVAAREEIAETVITVEDNGVGFDMAHTGQLFALFRRMHRKQDFDGEGTGLAVVQQLVQRHDGRIWAEAQVGHGATFHIAFPKPATDEIERLNPGLPR